MRKQTASKIWGVFLIVIGISVAGHVFGWWTLRLFQGWWTLFIIVPCIISMIQDGVKTANAVGLGIGIVLLLSERTLISWAMLARLFIPVALVAAGLMLLLKGPATDNEKAKEDPSADKKNEGKPSAQPDALVTEYPDYNEEQTLDDNTAEAEGLDEPTS